MSIYTVSFAREKEIFLLTHIIYYSTTKAPQGQGVIFWAMFPKFSLDIFAQT